MDRLRLRDNPTALTAVTVALWSTGAVLGKLLSESSGYLELVLGFLIAAATIVIIRMTLLRRRFPRKLFTVRTIAVGIVGYGLYWICYFKCFRLSDSASLPVLFNYTWPIFTVIFSHMMNSGSESPARVKLIELGGMALGLAGIWFAVSSGTEQFTPQLAGVIGWGLAAGASYGLFSAFSATIAKEDQLDFLLLAIVASSLFLLPFSFDEFGKIYQLTLRDLGLIALFGVGSEALGSLFWLQANRQARELNIDISRAASLIFFLPLLSLVIISIVFGERDLFRPGFFIGCLFVTGCVAVCNRAREIAGWLAPNFNSNRGAGD